MKDEPMAGYVYLYNAGYPLHQIQQLYRDRRLAQPFMTSYPPPADKPYSFERYRDDIDEHRWRDSSTISDGDWTSAEEDERVLGINKEAVLASVRSGPMARRPLIAQVRNDWRIDPKYGQMHSPPLEHDAFGAPDCLQIMCARRFKRVVFLLVSSLILFCVLWATWLGPRFAEHLLLRGSLDTRVQSGKGWFGANMRPIFADVVQLKTLDASLVPTGKGKDKDKRLIIVGDVHGCKDEFFDLLSALSFSASTDHLIFAGDLISKGPFSTDVVALALSLNASCVRGNHEDRILLARRDLNNRRLSRQTESNGPNAAIQTTGYIPHPSQPSGLDTNQFPHGNAVDRALAASFTKEQIAYLASCPVILNIGQLPGLGDVNVVHAGLVPGAGLERQDPSAVMSMRSIDLNTHVPSRDANDGVPWTKLWNKYQGMLPKKARSTVLYGHDSKRGLVLEKWTKGLDTGCVKGGRLTAMVIENPGGWRGRVTTRVVSVRCNDYRPRDIGVLGQS